MSITVKDMKENPIFHRKELKLVVEFTGATPKKADVIKMIAAKEGCEEMMVALKVIKNQYGEQRADVVAFVYNNLEEMKKLEDVKEPEPEAPAEGEEKAEESSE